MTSRIFIGWHDARIVPAAAAEAVGDGFEVGVALLPVAAMLMPLSELWVLSALVWLLVEVSLWLGCCPR